MTDTSPNFLPHEWIARDAYWGSPESFTTAPAVGGLAVAGAEIISSVARASDVSSEYRRMCAYGREFSGRAVPVPLGDPLPVLGKHDPGVLQVVHDERMTFTDPTSPAAKRAAKLAVSAEEFDEAAYAMERPGALRGAVMTEVDPGVLVSRGVWYVRGIRLPFGLPLPRRYSNLKHMLLTPGQVGLAISQLRQPIVNTAISGDIDTRTTRIVENEQHTQLSRVATVMHLRPEAMPKGTGKRHRVPFLPAKLIPSPQTKQA